MKGEALKRYLENPRAVIRARGLSASRSSDGDLFELELDIDLPQRPVHDIRKMERVRVRMPADDSMPEVFALRKKFPPLPHTMVNGSPYPRQLCVYERPWAEERTNWSPRSFVERIRGWFSGTANGTLHPDDQPLEPVLPNSPLRIVLPEIPLVHGKLCRVERLFVVMRGQGYFAAFRNRPAGLPPKTLPIPVLVVRGPTVNHGIMHQFPANLAELEMLLVNLGGSLVSAIASELGPIRGELLAQPKLPLFLVIELPKTRHVGGHVEDVEYRAFCIEGKLDDLFGADTVLVKEEALFIPKKSERLVNHDRLKSTQLHPLSVRWHLTRELAARANGHAASSLKIVSIGGGALGAQLANNLYRGGFGEWTIIDDDDLEPHNPARHLLGSAAVGFAKAEAVAHELGGVFPDSVPPRSVVCNYLAPGERASDLVGALKDAELILDLSASVTVERRLARDDRTKARRISAFLNQRGDESVLLIEDRERRTHLFWLEALYYRAVATESALRGHFDDAGSVAHRYGNGCREISTVVPQDGVALHAGLLSHGIRKRACVTEASIVVHRWNRHTNAVATVEIPVTTPAMIPASGWEILVCANVVHGLRKLRAANLPRETGGILTGTIDRASRTIAMTGFMPAPPDSEAWPTSFIRGSNGLTAEVNRLNKRSLGNLVYVGEWHSHPDGCNSMPSAVDAVAVGLSSKNMRADDLPTVMLIVAALDVSVVFQPTDDDQLHVTIVDQSLLSTK